MPENNSVYYTVIKHVLHVANKQHCGVLVYCTLTLVNEVISTPTVSFITPITLIFVREVFISLHVMVDCLFI